MDCIDDGDKIARLVARQDAQTLAKVPSKTVPLMTLHWYWQPAHCQYCRPRR
jgi:hypothetical protein